MLLPIIPHDKAMHVLYGVAISMAVAAVAAITKEATDALANRRAVLRNAAKPHGVEALDVVATIAGAGMCWAAAAFSDWRE